MHYSRGAFWREIVMSYRYATPMQRGYVMARAATCPFAAVLAPLEKGMRVLDAGCGAAITALLAARQGCDAVAFDCDEKKLAIAAHAAAHVSRLRGRMQVLQHDVSDDFSAVARGGRFDAVCFVDMLHALPPLTQSRALTQAAGLLGRGGLLIIKTTDPAPSLRSTFDRVQEELMINLLRVNVGMGYYQRDIGDVERELVGLGFAVTRHPCSRGYVHPHVVLLARRL